MIIGTGGTYRWQVSWQFGPWTRGPRAAAAGWAGGGYNAIVQAAPPDATIILVRDLLLGSKVIAAAKAARVAHVVVRDPARLSNAGGHRLIVDLNLDGAIDAAADWLAARTGRSAVGFVAHVDTETVQRARERGIGRVVARGRFFQSLPELFAEPRLATGDEDVSE